MRLFLLPALLAVPAPLLAQTAPPPITREQAMTKPPEQLADIALRQLGERVTSVTRPNFNPGAGVNMVSALQHLEFATAPHATDVVGLCAANRIAVEFEPPATRPGVNTNVAEAPVRVRTMRAAEVYKVVGEIEPYAEVSEARAAEEDRRCAAAGPVIPADYNDHAQAFFFNYQGGVDRVTALLVLQRAITEAREGRYRDIRCGTGLPECRDPRALLGGLDLANLTSLSSWPNIVRSGRAKISAAFLVSGNAHSREYRMLTVEADLTGPGEPDGPIRNLGRTEFDGYMTIDN